MVSRHLSVDTTHHIVALLMQFKDLKVMLRAYVCLEATKLLERLKVLVALASIEHLVRLVTVSL